MSQVDKAANSAGPSSRASERPGGKNALVAELPYAAMLLGAFFGVAANNLTGRPPVLYWQLLVPIYGLICVLAGRAQARETTGLARLIWTQALHWLACIIAMRLLFLPQVRGVISDDATGLSLLVVLALATFLAGLHAGIWRIAVVGSLLALSVPAAAWLQRSALLLAAEALLLVGAAAIFLWTRFRRPAPASSSRLRRSF